MAEDTSTNLVFTVNDSDTASSNLVITAVSANTNIIAQSGLVFSSTSSNRSLTITPVAHASGTNLVQVLINDGNSTQTNNIVVVVTPVNDLPVISAVANQTIDEDANVVIGFTISDVETPADALTLTATSSNGTLLPVSRITFGGSGSSRTATLSPALNQFGTTTVRFVVTDANGGSSSNSFTVTVNSVNDAPDIGFIADQTTGENKTIVIPFTASDAEKAAGNLTYAATSSNPTVVPLSNIVFGGSGTNRTLTITPALNQSGTVIINVAVGDGDLTSNRGFILEVLPNQPPSINFIDDLTINEDTSGTVTLTLSDDQSANLTVTATSSNPSLIPVSRIAITGSGNTRTVTLSPLANASGTAIINFTVSDGRASSSAGFVLTVNPVNDAPTISGLGNQTVLPGAINRQNFSLVDPDNNAGDLIITATSSDQNVVADADILLGGSGTNRVIAVSPKSGVNSGTATITVTAKDPNNASSSATFTVTIGGQVAGRFNPPTVSGGNFTVSFVGSPNTTYTVEGSNDLRTWTTVRTVTTDANGNATFTEAATGARKFYRTR